jgi:hypothetical protein
MRRLLALAVLTWSVTSFASVRLIQRPASDARLRLEAPLFEAPFNLERGFIWPSGQQAVAVTTDVYDLVHWGIGRALDPWGDDKVRTALGITAISFVDALTFFVAGPTTSAWTHEEFHQTVLTTRGVASRNPLSAGLALPLLAPATLQVNAEEAEALKQRHPEEYAYVNVAGFQAHAALAQRFERNIFFDDQPALSNFIIGLNHLLPPIYYLGCLGGATSGDCSIQVKHLFAPSEPSSERALTTAEEAYLAGQLGLSLLNLLDPFLYTIRGVAVTLDDGRELTLNAAVRHVPTPFGQEVRVDGYLKLGQLAGRVSIHNGFNQVGYFPGLSAEAQWWWNMLGVTGSVSGWLQPLGQSFSTAQTAPGGHASLRVGLALLQRRVEPWLEGEAKSAGWLLTNPYLTAKASLRIGVTLRL